MIDTQQTEAEREALLPTDRYGETAIDRLTDLVKNGTLDPQWRADIRALLALTPDHARQVEEEAFIPSPRQGQSPAPATLPADPPPSGDDDAPTPALIEAGEVERASRAISKVLWGVDRYDEGGLFRKQTDELARAALSTESPPRSLETADVREALAGLVAGVEQFCDEPGGPGISGFLSARLTDARNVLRTQPNEATDHA